MFEPLLLANSYTHTLRPVRSRASTILIVQAAAQINPDAKHVDSMSTALRYISVNIALRKNTPHLQGLDKPAKRI
jgi:hypothetical protein